MIKSLLLFQFILSMAAFAGIPDSLSFSGKISIQGNKYVGTSDSTASRTGNNLDQWWGRAVVSAFYSTPAYQSQVELYMYPSGFGYEPLINASYDQETDSITLERTEADKIQLSNAWVCFSLKFLHARVGRFETMLTPGTGFFGDYIDQDLYSGFNAKGSTHNGIDFFRQEGPFFGSVMFQSGDPNLNKGRIRFETAYIGSMLELHLAYRNNILSQIHDKGDYLQEHRMHGTISCILSDWKPYIETAFLGSEAIGNSFTWEKVLAFGLYLPTGRLLDLVVIEGEFVKDREIEKIDGTTRTSPFLWNVQVQKNLTERLSISGAFFADPLAEVASDFGWAGRFTAKLW